MSMVKWLYSPVTTGFYKLMTPYQYGLGLLSDGLGADLRFLFGDKFLNVSLGIKYLHRSFIHYI